MAATQLGLPVAQLHLSAAPQPQSELQTSAPGTSRQRCAARVSTRLRTGFRHLPRSCARAADTRTNCGLAKHLALTGDASPDDAQKRACGLLGQYLGGQIATVAALALPRSKHLVCAAGESAGRAGAGPAWQKSLAASHGCPSRDVTEVPGAADRSSADRAASTPSRAPQRLLTRPGKECGIALLWDVRWIRALCALNPPYSLACGMLRMVLQACACGVEAG